MKLNLPQFWNNKKVLPLMPSADDTHPGSCLQLQVIGFWEIALSSENQ